MILLASISGIQDFLFDVREEGGGQARSLRHRSFRIQLLAECVAIRLLEAAGLARDKLLFCAAAKVAIDATGITTEALDAVRSAVADLESHLLNETHGRLRLAFAAQDSADTFATTMQRAERALRRSKARLCTVRRHRALEPCISHARSPVGRFDRSGNGCRIRSRTRDCKVAFDQQRRGW